MKKKQTAIDPKRFYTLGEIVREELIPGINSVPKASRLVRTDAMYGKVLRAQIVPMGQAIQYKVRGSNLIEYLVKNGL